MIRMRRALGALKQAEMARLSVVRQAAAAARAEAETLRQSAASLGPCETLGDMLATSRWQGHAVSKARAADARARRIEIEARPLEQALARTIGRESVVDTLLDQARVEARRLAERRAEGS